MSFFVSLQAKLIMAMALPVIFMTQRKRFDTLIFVTQLLIYLGVAYNADCLVEGGCGMWSWMSISVPLLYSILYVFFSNRLNLRHRPPSPPTLLMPIERSTSKE